MEVLKKGIDIIPDNEDIFIAHLISIIESTDELCSLQISKEKGAYRFRIAPSVPKYIDPLIQEITKFSNLFELKLDFSKSIKTLSVINFSINLEI